MITDYLPSIDSSLWNAKGVIYPLSIAVPATIVAGKVVHYAYQNSSALKEKAKLLKESVRKSFSPLADEPGREHFFRISKTILKTCLVVGGVVSSLYCPFLLLPAFLAIPSATTTICLVGELLVNGKKECNAIQAKVIQAAEFIKDAFTKRPEETEEEAKKRISQNIYYAIAGAVLLAGAATSFVLGAQSLVHFILSHLSEVGIWNLEKLLPCQTPAVVFCEYAFLGLLHAGKAYQKWQKGEKAEAVFHLLSSMLSFVFPSCYLAAATENAPMRLHHSFIGLFMQLLPSKALQALGSFITFDSFLNVCISQRGFLDPYKQFHQYDFQNIIVDNFAGYLKGFSIMVGIEYALARLLPKKKKFSVKNPDHFPIILKYLEKFIKEGKKDDTKKVLAALMKAYPKYISEKKVSLENDYSRLLRIHSSLQGKDLGSFPEHQSHHYGPK